MKQLTYPISPDYVKGWTAERAIGELIANAWDEDPQFSYIWEDGVLTIEDQGPGIPESGLILGVSSKGDSSIGQFGEGKKISALVLARESDVGRVRFDTAGYSFEPGITEASVLTNGKGGIPMLAYTFHDPERDHGTKITIECDRKLADSAADRFLFLRDRDYETPPEGRVIDDGRGQVFIGGVLIKKSDYHYSYDLPLTEAKTLQNRDRTEVSGWELDRLTLAVRSANRDPEFLKRFTGNVLDGVVSGQEASIRPGPYHRKVLMEAAADLLGDPVYFSTDRCPAEAELSLNDDGYTKIKCPAKVNGRVFESLMDLMGVRSAGALVKTDTRKQRTTDWVAKKSLTGIQKENMTKAVEAVRGLYGARAVDKYGVFSRSSAGDINNAAGLYIPTSGKIGLHISVLDDFEKTLSVLIHEAGHRLRHKFGGYDYQDRTRGFESQLQEMASIATMKLIDNELIDKVEPYRAPTREDKDPLGIAYGKHIKQICEDRNLKAKDLVEKSGIRLSAARALMNGRTSILPGELEAVAETLGVDQDRLVAGWFCLGLKNSRRNKNGDLTGNKARALRERLEMVSAESLVVKMDDPGYLFTEETSWHEDAIAILR